MEDKKKMAAISAVVSMLTSEQPNPYEDKMPPHQPTEWTIYGRQQTMNYRDMYSRRFIKRNK
jgi:hypothetical protein